MDELLAANRANWDDRVPIHAASRFYDLDGWLAAPPGPTSWEVEALGDVAGLDLVHLQCHIGTDTLAFANVGARVTGLDFSPAAIEQARLLATRAGLEATFVEANVLDAAEALAPATFDIVYVSLGALCWLPSVDRWASQVAALLRPGGRLYLHDGHPIAWACEDDDIRIAHTCFEEAEPFTIDDDVTYTDGEGRMAHVRQHEWNHSIGEIITAVLDHDLRIDGLTEHDWTGWPRFPWLVETGPRQFSPPPGQPRVPLTFTLLASRPA